MRLFVILCLALVGLSAPAESKPAAPSRLENLKPWLGVGFVDVPSGVRIEEVVPDSPADIAGLISGDVIDTVGAVKVQSGRHFESLIQAHKVGDEISLRLLRGGRSMKADAILTAYLDEQELIQRRLVDKAAPDFSLEVLDGRAPGSVSKLRGKVVLLFFWSTRCQMCTDSFATLSNLQLDHLGDLVVLGVTGDSKNSVESFLQKEPSAGITMLHDPRLDVHEAYRYDRRVPTMVVIGRDGIINHADTGRMLRLDDIVLAAKRALRQRPSI